MSAEAQTIPDEIAQRTARLINEAENMRAQAVDDLKTIYGDLREELKALGWAGQNVSKEVAALKGAIAEMRLDEEKKAKREEKGDRVDDYVSILSRGRARAPARTRENIDEFPSSDGGAVAAVKGKARLANADGVEPPPSEHSEATQIATNEGGASPEEADTAAEGSPNLEPSGPEAERATSFTAKPPSPLRPHCRHPEACGGYGRNHCHTCAKAIEREMA